MKAKPLAIFALIAAFGATSAFADDHVVGTGTFTGKSDHETSGTVTVEKTDAGYVLKLGGDFKFDGAPDPKLAFGKGGYKKDTLFTKLTKNEGAQTYTLPKNIDPTKYDEVWLWCEKFNVPLGLAPLK
ncbi:MAG: DM13 domain-containing protein [Verrucomicrobiota bacterium]